MVGRKKEAESSQVWEALPRGKVARGEEWCSRARHHHPGGGEIRGQPSKIKNSLDGLPGGDSSVRRDPPEEGSAKGKGFREGGRGGGSYATSRNL